MTYKFYPVSGKAFLPKINGLPSKNAIAKELQEG
jgi:hypothetical protein